MSQEFVRLCDIKLADDIKGRVERHESFGAIISITDNIRGLCPLSQISDAPTSNPEKYLKIGSTVAFRVLSIDYEKNRLILTHKKSLMVEKDHLILSYENVKSGDSAIGVISSIQDHGCVITFFNNVKAFAPLAELTHEFIDSASTMFKIGQTVKCRVLTVNPTEEKMRVTLKNSQIADSSIIKVGMVRIFKVSIMLIF